MSNRTNLLFPDRKKALEFGAWIMSKHPDEDVRRNIESLGIQKYQNEGSNQTGGNVVPGIFSNTVQDAIDNVSVFRANSTLVRMTSDRLLIPKRLTQATAAATIENLAASESEGTWGVVMLSAAKWMAATRASSELSEDSVINFGQKIANEFAVVMSKTEDDVAFNADGTSTYHGMVGLTKRIIDGTHTASAITAAAGHDTFREIDEADLASMMEKLPERFWPTAKFYCSGYAQVNTFMRLGATVGGLINTISGMRPQMSYMGIPICITPKLPGSGSQTGKAMILFGDLAESSIIGVRRDMRLTVLKERYVDFDQIGVLCSHRFSIVHHELGDNTNAGPVVALVGA